MFASQTQPLATDHQGMNEKLRNLRWCANCLSMSTRPRITFDSRGFCNACRWVETKKSIDWTERISDLERVLDTHRRSDGRFDCLIPVSGGKDGGYVSHSLKHRFGMHPLAITITPPLALALGETNLKAFNRSGYDLITVKPDYKIMQILNKGGFVEKGFPYYGWMTAIHTAVVRMAVDLGIELVFYGEDGEVEYGGSSENDYAPGLTVEYIRRAWLEGDCERVYEHLGERRNDAYFFTWPSEEELKEHPVHQYSWSYFENWDPYRNYLVAKEHCGLREAEESNSGTFTNFAQNDQSLYALHTYVMYLKFGFGRANQDACIEVRRGAMDRQQAVNLVRLYDGQYPEEFMDEYLDYYEMKHEEFDSVLDRYADRDLFEKVDGRWSPRFVVQ